MSALERCQRIGLATDEVRGGPEQLEVFGREGCGAIGHGQQIVGIAPCVPPICVVASFKLVDHGASTLLHKHSDRSRRPVTSTVFSSESEGLLVAARDTAC